MMRKTVQEPTGNGSKRAASRGLVGPAVLSYPGLSKAFAASFLLDLIWIHMEKRSKTPDPSLGEFLWTAGRWREEEGSAVLVANIPLGCHPRIPMGTQGALGMGGAKTNLIYATEN